MAPCRVEVARRNPVSIGTVMSNMPRPFCPVGVIALKSDNERVTPLLVQGDEGSNPSPDRY
jgi:hypothetical protein